MIVQFVDSITDIPHNNSRFFHDRKVEINGKINGNDISKKIAIMYKNNGKTPVPQLHTDGDIILNKIIKDEQWYVIDIEKIMTRHYLVNKIISGYPIKIIENIKPKVIIKSSFDFNAVNPTWELYPNYQNFMLLDYMGVIALDDNKEIINNKLWMSLPRFIVEPKYSYEQLGTSAVGSVGQVYGRIFRQIKTMTVNFTRIKADTLDSYYSNVGTIKPHWVVPYPEAIDKFPPMWAVLTSPPDFTKRAENGWYWNTSLTWKEVY